MSGDVTTAPTTEPGHEPAPTPEPTSTRRPLWKRILRVLPYVGVVVSLVVLAAPAIMDRLDALRAGAHISTVSSTVSSLSVEEKTRFLEQAQRYNARLAGESVAEGEELLPYETQLCTDETTMMAWVEIPGIDVRLPVYHGTGQDELAAGVGHVQSSSLPVGGASTHCVLTAHSGMSGSRMFDDIRLLEPGDVFVLWTLGDPLAYEVVDSEVVLPDETQSLRVVAGEDRCTLVTCTPYGVNSHRLLVHARRCAYEPDAVASATPRVTSRILPLILAAVAILVVIIIAVTLRGKRRALRGYSPSGTSNDRIAVYPRGSIPMSLS